MGRRSDHSREELRELILKAGETLMAEVGFADFSAREVAKRIGYSIGTIHNVFGSVDVAGRWICTVFGDHIGDCCNVRASLG